MYNAVGSSGFLSDVKLIVTSGSIKNSFNFHCSSREVFIVWVNRSAIITPRCFTKLWELGGLQLFGEHSRIFSERSIDHQNLLSVDVVGMLFRGAVPSANHLSVGGSSLGTIADNVMHRNNQVHIDNFAFPTRRSQPRHYLLLVH